MRIYTPERIAPRLLIYLRALFEAQVSASALLRFKKESALSLSPLDNCCWTLSWWDFRAALLTIAHAALTCQLTAEANAPFLALSDGTPQHTAIHTEDELYAVASSTLGTDEYRWILRCFFFFMQALFWNSLFLFIFFFSGCLREERRSKGTHTSA